MSRHKGYGVSKLVLIAAAAPSLIKRPNFPYGLDKENVLDIINSAYTDRPLMLRNFGDTFFFQHTSQEFMNWFWSIGIQAASWATIAIANTWLNEVLFADMQSIYVPTLIMQGVHDKIVPQELSEIQHKLIRNSKYVPFNLAGHGVFYDQKDEFNETLVNFIENRYYTRGS